MGALEQAKNDYFKKCFAKRNLFHPIFAEIYQSEYRLEEIAKQNSIRLTQLRGDVNKPPVISVIITAYNEAPSILWVLDSIGMNENAPPTEVIVVDNTSNDQTGYLSSISGARVIKHGNKGYSKARRAGILAAEGEITLHTDADCFCSPHLLDATARYFNENPEMEACFAPEQLTSENGESIRVDIYNAAKKAGHRILSRLSKKHLEGNGRNFAAKRDALLQIGGGFDPEICLASDLDTAWQFIKRGTMGVNRDKDAFVLSSARKLEQVGFLTIAMQRLFKTDIPFILGADFRKRYLEDVREKIAEMSACD